MASKDSGTRARRPPIPPPVQTTKLGPRRCSTPPLIPPKPSPLLSSRDRSHSMEYVKVSPLLMRRGSDCIPPKVPPRPQRSKSIHEDMMRSSLSGGLREKHNQQLYESTPLSLQELVDIYSSRFPVQIRVTEGYRGQTPELTICNADVYNVHFMKHHEVVRIRDHGGHEYSIPLSSSVQFGLLYKHIGKAAKTPVFTKVSDILALKRLPKVVCATVAWKNEKCSMKENEVLVIKRVHKPKFHGKSLEVFSVNTKSTKLLPGDCKGVFSTDPSLMPLHLSVIVEHVPNPFPCQAVMMLSEQFTGNIQHISSSLLHGTVTMIERKTETSLVASSSYDPARNPERYNEVVESPLLDIPIGDSFKDVRVAVIKSKDKKQVEHLYESTQDALENFDPSKLKSYRDVGSARTNEIQAALYAGCRSGSEKYGVTLDTPAYNQVKPTPGVSQGDDTSEPLSDSDSSDDNYETISPHDDSPSTQFPQFHPPHDPTAYTIPVEGSPLDEPHYKTVRRDRHQDDMLAEIRELKSTISQLTTKVRSLQKEVPSGESAHETNRNHLKSLTIEQVQDMLEAMSLGQYREKFAREQITGEILMELDDDILREDLGVSNRVHRIRIMMVVSGRHSIQEITSS